MDFNAIDWNALWQESSALMNCDQKSQKDIWNQRAESFSKRIIRVADGQEGLDKDDYISKMLARIEVRPEWSILDIGCGPGTLTIPLAKKAKSVTALDFSAEMLGFLKINADKNGLNNINYLNSSWQDAFKNRNLGEYDIVIASRSLISDDMKSAIFTINSIARQTAYITLPIIHLSLDFEVFKAIGRNDKKHAPYIYVYNLLYQMGIMANVEILHSKVKMQFPNISETIENLQFRTDPFTPAEKVTIKKFLERKLAAQRDSTVFTHDGYSIWALIWWWKAINNNT